MRKMYKLWYRLHGIRHMSQLLSPPVVQLDEFSRSALFHHVSDVDGPFEVDTAMPYFQGYSKKILISHIVDYVKAEGPLRRPIFNLAEVTRQWKRKNRQAWTVVEEDVLLKESNPEVLAVVNYGYLDRLYKYLPVQMAKYYRWLNRQRTVWNKVNEIANKTDRQQYIFYPIPSILQGRTLLDKYSKEAISIKQVEVMGQAGAAGYMQLDMWKWLGVEYRKSSLLGVVEEKNFPRVNLIFRGLSGQIVIVNLGYLNSWIKGQPNQTEFGSIVQFEALYMQKLFLKLCMTLNSMAIEEDASGEVVMKQSQPLPVESSKPIQSTEEDPVDDEGSDPEETPTPVPQVERSNDDYDPSPEIEEPEDFTKELAEIEDLPVKETRFINNPKTLPSKKTSAPAEVKDEIEEVFKIPTLNSDAFDDLEKDMAVLDRLSLNRLKNTGIKLSNVAKGNSQVPEEDIEEVSPVESIDPEAIRIKAFEYKDPVAKFKERLDKEAEVNLITASDYRKMQETVEKYQVSPDPYGSKLPRIEAMKINPEDILIKPEDISIPVTDVVPDVTMAKSTLLQYDKTYIKKILKQDTLNAVDSVQAVGVAIRRHEIDVTHSALGSYERHVLELKPIDGVPSTIQFTFPKIEEDGTFMAGGNKYLMRKQRVD